MANKAGSTKIDQADHDTNSLSTRLNSFRFEPEPLQRGVHAITEGIVETGRLPGAPAAHQKLADIVEYAQAIINSTTTVAEAITPQDLKYFAWGLPTLADQRPRDSELDTKDIQNLITLNKCLPTADADIGHYHVSATIHASKLLLIAALNPRAIEWMFLAAVMVQRGLATRITDLLVNRKDRFQEVMHKDLTSQADSRGIDRAIIAFDATLDRVIVNVVSSLKSLELGALGGELTVDGDLPDQLDFDYYVTADPVVYSAAREAGLMGCQFHEEAVLIEAGTVAKGGLRKRARLSQVSIVSTEASQRLQRIAILQNAPHTSCYHIRNMGPTGRVPHAKLVSGLVHHLLSLSIPSAQRQKFLSALSLPSFVPFNLEVDLSSGIGNILVGQSPSKGALECSGFSFDSDLPEPVPIAGFSDISQLSQFKDTAFLKFGHVAIGNSVHWDDIVSVYLVVRGWWWSKHLIRDLPSQLYVPHHSAYFSAMIRIGMTLLHLEQCSGCEVTLNALFDALRLLTNLGGTHDTMTEEAAVYAAQGPGGTLVHDILGEHQQFWPQNYCIAYRWLRGKFYGVPEVALFAHGCEFRNTMPIPDFSQDQAQLSQDGASVTIFADSTDGHTLSCAVVTQSRKIRTLPFVRLLCGILTAYIGANTSCGHVQGDIDAFLRQSSHQTLPWSIIVDRYYGRAEISEEDQVMVTGVEDDKLYQVIALAVTKEGSAIDTHGCVLCAFESSDHVIQFHKKEA